MTSAPVVRHPAARWRRCVDGVVVMAPDASEPVFLASPGDTIWQLIDTPMAIEYLIDELATRFDGGRDAIGEDVASFVKELERAGLVQR